MVVTAWHFGGASDGYRSGPTCPDMGAGLARSSGRRQNRFAGAGARSEGGRAGCLRRSRGRAATLGVAARLLHSSRFRRGLDASGLQRASTRDVASLRDVELAPIRWAHPFRPRAFRTAPEGGSAMATTITPMRRANLVGRTRTAVTCGDVELTYAQTWDRCRRLIGALCDLGLAPGDRVAVIAGNCHRYLELYQAVPGAGFSLVPLNPRHAVAELRYALEDSGARVLFTGVGDQGLEGTVEHIFDLGDGYEGLLAGSPADFPDDLPEDTVAGLFYTGGTTGAAKGVMLTHRNLIANALHFQACWPFGPDTCWLVVAPLFHAAGSIAVLATVWNAGEQVVLPAFDPGAALDLVQSHHVTATLVVPTMLAALSEEQLERPRDVSSLRWISHGGAPIATETLRRAHAALPDATLL